MKTNAFTLLLCFSTLALADRQPFAPQDWWLWRTASDPRISPDGQVTVYVEGWRDREANASLSNLWLAPSDGKTRRRLTEGNWRDSHPRWSPDSSKIAWISDRGGKPHIRVRRPGAEGETEVRTGESPLNLVWSPDGAALAFTALVAAKPEAPAWAPPAILSRLPRGRAGYLHVFVVQANGSAPARQISSGDFDHQEEPVWMPDGQSILTVRDGEVWEFRLTGGAPKLAIRENGRLSSPLPSPDGSKLAWLSTTTNAQSYAVHKLYVMAADGTRVKLLTGQLDRDPLYPQWSSDSRTIYFVADDRGATHVYAARSDGTVRQVTSAPERMSGFSLADNGRAVAVRSNAQEGGDVVTFTVDRISQLVTLASPNEKLLAERHIGAVEELSYDSSGQAVQGWVVKPPSFDASKKYPLLLDIRDDPRTMYGVDFNLRAQIFASAGFVVLCVNPRGVAGYGEQFGNLLRSRYPGDDYDDLMRGVDAAIAKGYVDPQRLMVAGGLLSAWTIGHTDRFRAAVARRPVVDWALHVATHPDGAYRARHWMGTLPWEEPDQYTKHSPIYFLQNVKTPTLILAGDSDSESDELYFALRQKKVTAALVRMPVGDKPADSILEFDTVLAWLGEAVRNAPNVK